MQRVEAQYFTKALIFISFSILVKKDASVFKDNIN